jgi:hypothetical protein
MALKNFRSYRNSCPQTKTNTWINETAEAGQLAAFEPGATGSGKHGDINNTVIVSTDGTELPAGMFLADYVDHCDPARYCYKGDMRRLEDTTCSPALLAVEGTYFTDQVANGITVEAGDPAYMITGGLFSNTGNSAAQIVGSFTGPVQSDGYVGVELHLA